MEYIILFSILFTNVLSITRGAEYPDARIINGVEATLGEFPYQASVQKQKVDLTYEPICGGCIITSNHVLTAAACVHDLLPQTVRVEAGMIEFNSNLTTRRGVSLIIVHPSFNKDTLFNDIAILKLAKNFIETATLKRIPLRMSSTAVGVSCTMSGWGFRNANDTKYSTKLIKMGSVIVNHTDCALKYNLTVERKICAQSQTNQSPCHGDRGGPLVCNGALTGLSSFIDFCEITIRPPVYTEIFQYYDWIKNITSVEEISCDTVTHATRIIGGTPSGKNEFPYMVSLQRKIATSIYQHMCGGTLVSLSQVLTTAFCAYSFEGNRSEIQAVAGTVQIYTTLSSIEIRRVEKILISKTYNTTTFASNYAILKLERPFVESLAIKPVTFKSTNNPVGKVCQVPGWGVTNSTCTISKNMMKVDTTIIDLNQCRKKYENSTRLVVNVICTGNIKGVCEGDNGSPLICDGQISGLISFINGCGTEYPAVYSDVLIYKTEIDKLINESAPIINDTSCYTRNTNIGFETEMKIMDGVQADISKFPHQVSVQIKNGNAFYPICGGSLISRNHILTSATCVQIRETNERFRVARPNEVQIVGGSSKLLDTNSKIFSVRKIVVHEQFNLKNGTNDIAVIQIEVNIIDSPTLKPISFKNITEAQGKSCKVSGWGKTEKCAISNDLNELDVEIINMQACKSSLNSYMINLDDKICSKNRNNKSICAGDAGAPLVCDNSLVGISVYENCNNTDRPIVHSDVTKYYDWIKSVQNDADVSKRSLLHLIFFSALSLQLANYF